MSFPSPARKAAIQEEFYLYPKIHANPAPARQSRIILEVYSVRILAPHALELSPYLSPPTGALRDPTPSRHCPSEPPPSPRYSKDSRTYPPLGGLSPALTAASGAVPGAGPPPEAAPAVTKGHSSRLRVAGLHSSVSASVSGQNRSLSSPRSCRKKPCSV
jgi:hypothetical protein